MSKSLVSKRRFVLEFAKKFFVDSGTANMVPLKDCIATGTSNSLLKEFAVKYDLTMNSVLCFLGLGYKAKMKFATSYVGELSHRARVNLVWWSMLGSLNPRITHGFEGVSLESMHKSTAVRDVLVINQLLDLAILYHKDYKLQFKEAVNKGILSIGKSCSEGNLEVEIREWRNRTTNSDSTDSRLVSYLNQISGEEGLASPIDKPIIDFPSLGTTGHQEKREAILNIFEEEVLLSDQKDIELYEKVEALRSNTSMSFDERFIEFNILFDTLLDELFHGDLMGKVPKEFGPTVRVTEKLFDDFNKSFNIGLKFNAVISKYRRTVINTRLSEKSEMGQGKDYPIVLTMELVPVSLVRDHGIERSPDGYEKHKRASISFGALGKEFLKALKGGSILSVGSLVFYLVRRGPEVQYVKEIITEWRDNPPQVVYKIVDRFVPQNSSSSILDSIWFWLLLIFGFGLILLWIHHLYLSNLNLEYDLAAAKAQAVSDLDSMLTRQELMSETIERLARNVQEGNDRETLALSMFEKEAEALLSLQRSTSLEIEALKARDGLFSVTRESILSKINHEQDNLRDQLINCLKQLTSGTDVPGLEDLIAFYRKELSSTQAKIDFITDPAILNSSEYALRISNILIKRIGEDPRVENSNILETVANNFMYHHQVDGDFIIACLFDSVI